MLFAKALSSLGVTERSSVAVMGFNSAQWFMAFMGTILYRCVVTGIYTTNSDDACMY
jgi:long-chain-fatty-acid--CoA ligase ACSBG